MLLSYFNSNQQEPKTSQHRHKVWKICRGGPEDIQNSWFFHSLTCPSFRCTYFFSHTWIASCAHFLFWLCDLLSRLVLCMMSSNQYQAYAFLKELCIRWDKKDPKPKIKSGTVNPIVFVLPTICFWINHDKGGKGHFSPLLRCHNRA